LDLLWSSATTSASSARQDRFLPRRSVLNVSLSGCRDPRRRSFRCHVQAIQGEPFARPDILSGERKRHEHQPTLFRSADYGNLSKLQKRDAYQSEKQEFELARSLCDSGSITNMRLEPRGIG
jgi:hypothetical protein